MQILETKNNSRYRVLNLALIKNQAIFAEFLKEATKAKQEERAINKRIEKISVGC